MAMLEEHRNAVYNYFAPRLGKEATQSMLSYFPARDIEEPATKADVTILRSEIERVRVELELLVRSQVDLLRSENLATEARLRAEFELKQHEQTNLLTTRMLTIAGLQMAAITGLLALFS